jgi:hypothetical protein
MTKITAPWDDATVAGLNRWQASGWVHAFTCGGERSDLAHKTYAIEHHQRDFGILVATSEGWLCPVCSYQQDWAHDFMVNQPIDPHTFLPRDTP